MNPGLSLLRKSAPKGKADEALHNPQVIKMSLPIDWQGLFSGVHALLTFLLSSPLSIDVNEGPARSSGGPRPEAPVLGVAPRGVTSSLSRPTPP
ncbi:hypothetical protein SKAU_G00162220 [Synaphobranchus kaupii]|uniref:Uncharacterized protein n=1 Tax=Synaphobranchus kaupii TaxID=118154 RepID=A0A9Q1FJ78_SYNKA|nr:hypothetical protein SKAU_G00162220 [Synaphobranchus kaupii]